LALDENLDLPRPFGPYTLLRRVAVGGMAEVYVGKTAGIGGFEKLVAIKVIHPRYAEDEHFVKMLVEEAKISVLLTHVNIAQTFDLGQAEDTYYIAMELVEGADGYRVMRKVTDLKKALPIDVCAFVVSEMCNGLDYAHRKRDPGTQQPLGIVHRDISPQNVLISFAGEVKIVDFGIAKAASRSEHTEAGVIKGKYYYMSPEQAWGDPMDHRSDIFSTGVVLYELLTGRMLYNDDNIPLLLDKVRKAEIAPPEKRRPSIPKSLSDVVMGALRKDAGDRYQSAQEFGHALTQWLYTNSPTFSAARLGDLMVALFPEENAKASGLVDLTTSGNIRVPVSSAPPPQLAPKPVIQLQSLADIGEDDDDVTRHDLLPFRKKKPQPQPAAEPPKATLRPAKNVAQRQTAPLPKPAAAPRANEVVTTNPLVAKHEPTDQTPSVDQWEDPTQKPRQVSAPEPMADDDFEDSTLVDANAFRQAQQALAKMQIVESARGRVNAAWVKEHDADKPPARRGSVPPPPSRAAWQPRAQAAEPYVEPDPPTAPRELRMPPPSEDRTIPITADDAATIARSLAAQRPMPPGWQQVPSLPTYAQPTRPLDGLQTADQPTVPRGNDPFAPPPPAPIERAPRSSSARTWIFAAVAVLVMAAVVALVLVPGEPAPSITILTMPAGAAVTIDGRPVGDTPVTITDGLEVGHAYQITVAHAGYGPRSIVVQAQPGPVDQQVVLTGLPARLHVESQPPGALITVGGTPRGAAPIDADAFMVGQTVEVRGSLPGHGLPVTQSVELTQETTSVVLTIP
jgi:serine/threonine protein kinase